MPRKVIETCSVEYISVLDETGEVDASLMPALSRDDIRRMYELMLLTRTFDHYALSLQREGRLGTYASVFGQEASQIGSAVAVYTSDWIFPSFREMGVYLAMGYPMHLLLQYWASDERGMHCPDHLKIFPLCVPVGTQIPHAVGAAMAVKYRKEGSAVVCYFGDGGTSKGDFHEGLNMAGVFKLPAVFICQNNHWAISVPRERQSASATLAQKACAYGIEGLQVDGNDVFAVYIAADEAVRRARNGGGPTFIECVTYRMSDHTTADDASRYRNAEDVAAWKAKDPVLRLRRYMEREKIWDEEYERSTTAVAEGVVKEAVKLAEASTPPQPEDMFNYTCESPSARQLRQMRSL